MIKLSKIISFIIFSTFVLMLFTGCNNGSTAGEKAFDKMEEAASKEKVFNDQQQPLVDEEKKEQDIYNKIMKLDMNEHDKISNYSDKALQSVEKRKSMMEKEKTSIDNAYKTFKEAKPFLNKVEEKDAQEPAKGIITSMEKRYNAFQSLYKSYSASIDNDTKLFKLLKDKELTTEQLQKQLKLVNDEYKTIEQNKEDFNTYTKEFNNHKEKFYDAIGINTKEE